jgi:glutathione S-transferase
MAGITLYVDKNFVSPYAMSAFVTLTEKKIPFAVETIDLSSGENLLPEFRDFTLTGRIPTLVHDQFVLGESTAIIEYLEDAFPAPDYPTVLPADLKQRAVARQVQAWIRSDLLALRAERSADVVFIEPTSTPLTPDGQTAAMRLIRIADRLIDTENLFGQWSIADTDLAMMLNRLICNGDPVPPRVAAYAHAQWQRDSVQQWLRQARG